MRRCILCIGNRDGGDDAIGPYIADHLPSTKTRKVIDAGTVPENFTGVIKQFAPKQLIIIDAVDMGLQPGDIRIVPKNCIGTMHISTHGIPLSVIIKYLQQDIPSILLIGIQPKEMQHHLSSHLKKSGHDLIALLLDNQINTIKYVESVPEYKK